MISQSLCLYIQDNEKTLPFQCFAEKEKPIKCRKVTFSDIVSIRNVSSHSKRGKTDQQDSGAKPVQASGSVSVESRDISSWPVTFFDFANEREREAFFQRLKQTRSFKFPAKLVIFFSRFPVLTLLKSKWNSCSFCVHLCSLQITSV